MDRREFLKMMKADGWAFVRRGGKHDVYVLGSHSFTVPRHSPVSSGIVRGYKKLMKEISEK